MANIITKAFNTIGASFKKALDRPSFGQNYVGNQLGSQWGSNDRWTGWGVNFNRQFNYDTNIDFKRECGPLDLSFPVMAACNYTGISLAEPKPVVMAPGKSGKMEIVPGHKAADLIRRPNPFYTWADYTLALAFSWWVDGNVYFKKVRNGLTGEVLELWMLPHFMVEPRWPGDGMAPEVPDDPNNDAFLSHYAYRVPGQNTVEMIPKADILHIKRGVNFANPRKGLGAFEPILTHLFTDRKISLFSAIVMKNMGMVPFIISPKEKTDTVTPIEAAAIKEQFVKNSSGDNLNKPQVMAFAMQIDKLGLTPQELDLSQLARMPQAAVASVTLIPAIVLQFIVGLEEGHYGAAYEQARQQGFETVIIPILTQIGEYLTWNLLPEFDQTPGAVIEFDLSTVRVLQTDEDELAKRAATLYLAGVAKRSESRELVGLESTPEDEVFFDPRGGTIYKPGEEPNAITGTNAGAPTAEKKPVPAKSFGSVADIERYLGILEEQMKGFEIPR